MKTTLRTVSLAFLAAVAFIAIAGCEGADASGDNNDAGTNPGDVSGGDKADDPCSQYGCTNPDLLPSKDAGADTGEPELCESDWDCQNEFRCNKFDGQCMDPETDPLNAFMWMQGNWKCTEAPNGSGVKGDTVFLIFINWNSEDEVALAKGFSPFNNWQFWYEDGVLHGYAISESGDIEVRDLQYNADSKQLSFTEHSPGTGELSPPWVYQLE